MRRVITFTGRSTFGTITVDMKAGEKVTNILDTTTGTGEVVAVQVSASTTSQCLFAPFCFTDGELWQVNGNDLSAKSYTALVE